LAKECYSYQISKRLVNELWEILIEETKIPSDGEAFFKWLVESCEQEEETNTR